MPTEEKHRVEPKNKKGNYDLDLNGTSKILEESEAQELVISLARYTDRLERFEIYRPHGQIGVHLRLRNENTQNGVPYDLTEFLDRHGWRISATGQDDSLGCTFLEVVKK